MNRARISQATAIAPASDEPVTVRAAQPFPGRRIPSPAEVAAATRELCDHCIDGTPHPHLRG